MSDPTILHAQASRAAADALRAALSGTDVSRAILLADEALAHDPERNQIARDALRFSALAEGPQGGLLIVAVGDAEAPLGLRDIERLPWTPGGAQEANELDAIRAALAPPPIPDAPMARESAAAPPRRRSGARLALGVLIGAFVLIGLGVVALTFVGAPAPDQAMQSEQAPGASVPGEPPQDYGEQIAARLGAIADELTSQGYEPAGARHNGALAADAQESVTASLRAGFDYVIAGVCDSDCRALELTLHDAAGAEIANDLSIEAAPRLVVSPQADGDYRVTAAMTACDIEPCYFAVQIYARPVGWQAPAGPAQPRIVPRAEAPVNLAPLEAKMDSIAADLADLRDRPQIPDALVYGTLALILAQFVAILVLALRRPRARAPAQSAAQTMQALPAAADGQTYFASYSRADAARVDPILSDIEKSGVPIWLDRVDIGGGTKWSQEIVQAIRGARGMILFCSPNAFNSDHVLREVDLASTFHKHLVPIMLEPAPVPDAFFYYLSTRQIIDVSAESEWRARVLSSLNASV